MKDTARDLLISEMKIAVGSGFRDECYRAIGMADMAIRTGIITSAEYVEIKQIIFGFLEGADKQKTMNRISELEKWR